MNNPELIYYNNQKLNEAMFWDADKDCLYFVSVRGNIIYKMDFNADKVSTLTTEGPVGGAVVSADGRIIEAEKSGIYSIDPKTHKKSLIKQIITDNTMRYNHLILDSRGRILVDVMGDEERHAGEGGLYQIDGDRVKCLVSGTTVANGIVLNKAENKLYFTDTPTRLVMEYDYDITTGDASNGRIIIDMAGEKGLPDGLMLDSDENYIWISEWASSKFSKWEIKTGKCVREIVLPSTHVTSSAIGGKNNEWIFVATAKANEEETSPAGGIFKIALK